MFRSRIFDKWISGILFLAMLSSLVVTVVVVALLGKEALLFFDKVSFWEFISGTHWAPLLEPKSFGVLPLVIGTLQIVVGSICIAVPAGVLVAVYLSEYASTKSRNIIKPVLEILAGIPTVVYGYFALTFITPILKTFIPGIEVFNALSAAIVVAIMILPMISSLCDDAFISVPQGIREGAYALGASTFEVITQVVIPAASRRVGAATILAISRAIGETMAVTLAAGATPSMHFHFTESIQTLTAYIVQVSLGDTPQGGIEYLSLFAVGALLFVLTFVMNIIGNQLVFKKRNSI